MARRLEIGITWCLGSCEPSAASSERAIFALGLFLVHLCARAYDSVFVTRYSPSARINVLHYLLGISFYIVTAYAHILPAASVDLP